MQSCQGILQSRGIFALEKKEMFQFFGVRVKLGHFWVSNDQAN